MFIKRFLTRVPMFVFYSGLFCYVGLYARAQADDYAFVNMLKAGFWESQKNMYVMWTGRCANTFLVSLACSLNPMRLYPFLPWMNALFNIAALYALLTLLTTQMTASKRFLTALSLQGIWFSMVPALNETFYWLSGMPYTWTAALSLWAAAISVYVLRGKKRGTSFILLLALVFFNGMILELTSVMQIAVAFFFLFCFLRRKNRKNNFAAWQMAFIFAAVLCAFGVMFFSPGNAARMSATMLSRFSVQNILRTLGVAAVFGGVTAVKFFTKPIAYLAILYSPVIAACVKPFDPALSKHLKAWHIFVLVAMIAPFQQAIAGFATGAGLPARAEGLAIWIMGAAWLSLWAFGYRNEAAFEKIRSLRVYPLRGVLLALCLLLSGNFIALLQDLRIAPLYAAEQRQRDVLVARQKAEGKTDIVVPALTAKPKLLFFSDLRPSPNDWKNQSFAEYWSVQSVSALPEELFRDEKARRDFQEGNLSGLETLASAGDPEVQFMLGEIYDTTFAPANNVAKDNAAAAKWYLMAAKQGHSHAQRRLTRFYALGMGVPKSYFHALAWFLRSHSGP
jgi:hypothetical protein